MHDDHHRDALSAAVSLGRLDVVSVLLTGLGVPLGLFAIISFSYFKYGAENAAREVADKVARETASAILNKIVVRPVSSSDAQERENFDSIDMQNRENENEEKGKEL